MTADNRLVTVVVDHILHLVGTVMPPLLGLDLVTQQQGLWLGAAFFTLLAASIGCALVQIGTECTPRLSGNEDQPMPSVLMTVFRHLKAKHRGE